MSIYHGTPSFHDAKLSCPISNLVLEIFGSKKLKIQFIALSSNLNVIAKFHDDTRVCNSDT